MESFSGSKQDVLTKKAM